MISLQWCIQVILLVQVVCPPVKSFTARLSVPRISAPSTSRYPHDRLLLASTDTDTEAKAEAVHVDQQLQEALAKMNFVMTADFYEREPTLKQFHAKITKNIEIKPSSIPEAGLGLFAKKPIKANTIVSFYPAHALGIDSESPFVTSNLEDASYFAEHPSSRSSYLHCTDQPLFQRPSILVGKDISRVPLYLDANPHRKDSDAWVSHYINDGAKLESNTETGVLEYYQRTKAAKNCIHIPFGPSPVLATVTTKKVKKGEELFTSYGGTYWLGVWLDVHGEEGVGITPKIQAEIQESARDLLASMKAASTVYKNQIEAMQRVFDNIQI